MNLQRNDVEFVRETTDDKPVPGGVELKVLCVYRPLKIGTVVYLNVLPGAKHFFYYLDLWTNHGAFLEEAALKALNEEIAARKVSVVQ